MSFYVLQENETLNPHMKYIRLLLLLALSIKAASAAITITITPDSIGGTTFSFSQTTANPKFPIGSTQGGDFLIDLPPSMFGPSVNAGGASSDISGTLTPILATFTDLGSGFNYEVKFLLIGSQLTFARFLFDRAFSVGQNQSEGQLDLVVGSPAISPISPEALIPGTHTISSNLFGSVTVVVIPEPTSSLLLILSTMLFSRRHRSQA